MSTSIKEAMEKAFTMKKPISLPPEWDDEKYQPEPQATNETNQPKENEMQATQNQAPLNTPRDYRGRNFVQETFNYIKANPGMTKQQYIVALMNEGHKEGTATSYLSQLLRSGLLRSDDQGHIVAYYPEYDPSKITKMLTKARTKRKVVKIVKREEPKVTSDEQIERARNLGDLLRAKLEALPVMVDTTAFNAEQFVNQQLTIKQAQDVYVYLRKVFGGNQA